jgi:molecular chaperone GrpE
MGKAAEDWPKLEDLDLTEFEVVEEPAPEPPAPFAQVKAIETFTPAPESKIPAPKPMGGPAVAELVAARAEIRRLEARCENLEGLHHEASKTLARRQADFDNFRRRVERERDEVRPVLISEVVTPLLPVVDNLERALATQSGLAEGLDADPQHFVQGVELIAQQLVNTLSSIGVEAVPAIGELFDPEIHEAVALEATDEYPPNTVTREILRGYKLGERLLRPAMVKVAAAPKPSPAESS